MEMKIHFRARRNRSDTKTSNGSSSNSQGRCSALQSHPRPDPPRHQTQARRPTGLSARTYARDYNEIKAIGEKNSITRTDVIPARRAAAVDLVLALKQ
jgi:hypothetical protein